MNIRSNFSKHLAIPAILLHVVNFSAKAQNPVQSTQVDEKYAYTTVVYKNTAASDADVLSSIENEYSVGDVIRVTLAPPTQPSAPATSPVIADKTKGEDAWLPTTASSSVNLTASATPNVLNRVLVNVVPEPQNQPEDQILAVQMATPTETLNVMPSNIATVSNSKVVASSHSAKAHKTVKKSAKKTGPKVKLKNRKPGKQRYACPKF